MNKRATAQAAAAAAGTTAPAIEGTLVHAYRRQPVYKSGPNGVMHGPDGQPIEEDVEVVFQGEKVKFRSNADGHIVGLVQKPETLHRLIKEIPEAYILYQGGENIPEKAADTGPTRPDGAFVLEGVGVDGAPVYVVLDDKDDDELRAFAAEAKLEAEQLPEVLKGEELRRAIYNLLGGAQ